MELVDRRIVSLSIRSAGQIPGSEQFFASL